MKLEIVDQVGRGHSATEQFTLHRVAPLQDVAELRQLWNELQSAPDATFVDVEETDQKVRVSKSGGYMLVTAFEGGEKSQQVDVRIPAAVVDALLSGEGEELDIAAAVRALAAHGAGELVTVTDDETKVRVWVDGLAEMR